MKVVSQYILHNYCLHVFGIVCYKLKGVCTSTAYYKNRGQKIKSVFRLNHTLTWLLLVFFLLRGDLPNWLMATTFIPLHSGSHYERSLEMERF